MYNCYLQFYSILKVLFSALITAILVKNRRKSFTSCGINCCLWYSKCCCASEEESVETLRNCQTAYCGEHSGCLYCCGLCTCLDELDIAAQGPNPFAENPNIRVQGKPPFDQDQSPNYQQAARDAASSQKSPKSQNSVTFV